MHTGCREKKLKGAWQRPAAARDTARPCGGGWSQGGPFCFGLNFVRCVCDRGQTGPALVPVPLRGSDAEAAAWEDAVAEPPAELWVLPGQQAVQAGRRTPLAATTLATDSKTSSCSTTPLSCTLAISSSAACMQAPAPLPDSERLQPSSCAFKAPEQSRVGPPSSSVPRGGRVTRDYACASTERANTLERAKYLA